MESAMKQPDDSSNENRKPAKGLPVEGGVVNRTDEWQREDGAGEGSKNEPLTKQAEPSAKGAPGQN